MTRRSVNRRRVLRWYPAAWRERYGNELVDLLSDTYADNPLPTRAWIGIVMAGVNERGREAALIGRVSRREDRIRAGALIVLAAWALFIVAGSGFAKYSEHWSAVTPLSDRTVPSIAIVVLQVATFVGVALCGVAALVSWPSFSRLAQHVGARRVFRLVRPAIVAGAISIAATAIIVEVSHHMSSFQRSVAPGPYRAVFLAWAGLLVVCLAVIVVTIGRVVLRIQYSEHQLRVLSVAALTTSAAMSVIFVSLVVWWVSIAQHASWFFTSGVVGAPGALTPVPMVGCGILMLAGLATAAWGSHHVVAFVNDTRSNL